MNAIVSGIAYVKKALRIHRQSLRRLELCPLPFRNRPFGQEFALAVKPLDAIIPAIRDVQIAGCI